MFTNSNILKYWSMFFILTLFPVSVYTQTNNLYSFTLKNFRLYDGFNEQIDIENPDIQRINAAIFYVTNEVRAKKRLPLLTHQYQLEQMAENYSKEMIKYNFFSHEHKKSKKLRTTKDRAIVADIPNPYIAENIIEGYLIKYKDNSKVIVNGPGEFRDANSRKAIPPHTYLSLADDLVDRWMHSKGHRENILSKDAKQLGCGVAIYTNKKFNYMPSLKATQNFQLYELVKEQNN